MYTGNSLSAPFSSFAIEDIQNKDKNDTATGSIIDYDFLKQLSPVLPDIPEFETDKSDDSDPESELAERLSNEGEQDQHETFGNRVENRIRMLSELHGSTLLDKR